MQKDRGFRILAIVALVIAVAGLSIGYAALGRDLNINTTATLKGSNWDVHFENLGAPQVTGITADDVTATLTSATQIDVTANLSKPGDKVVYTFDVKNGGTIDAKLSAVPTITGLTEANAAKINWSLTDATGNDLVANDPLNVAGVKSLKLTIEFDPNATDTDLVEADTDFEVSAILNYVQA